MIKAEDLRICDLVRCGEQVITIHAVYYKLIDDFVIGEETICISCEDLEPIPLTSEFLKKNGFEEVYPEECYTKRIDTLRKYIKKFISIEYYEYPTKHWKVFIKYDKWTEYVKLRNILYIHELQHILWALGEDANLKV